jgi:hypothetical protein
LNLCFPSHDYLYVQNNSFLSQISDPFSQASPIINFLGQWIRSLNLCFPILALWLQKQQIFSTDLFRFFLSASQSSDFVGTKTRHFLWQIQIPVCFPLWKMKVQHCYATSTS